MPTIFDDVEAKCPFFKYSGKQKIACEGITDDCTTWLMFSSEQKRNLHRKIFCNARYQNCEIFIMLNKKYEE